MPSDSELIDLWEEMEDALTSTPGELSAHTLAPVDEVDADWLRRTQSSGDVETVLVSTLEKHGNYFHRVIVQGRRCTTTPDLLRTLGDALEFPGYYGMNWDALNECMIDLLTVTDGRLGSYFGDRVGRKALSLVLTIDGAEHLLEKEPRSQLNILFDVFRWVAERPVDPLGRDVPRGQLFVLLRGTPTATPSGTIDDPTV